MDINLWLTTLLSAFNPAVLLGLKVALSAILADTAITWALKFTQGAFDIRLMPEFLRTNVFPYMSVLLIAALLTLTDYTVYEPVFYLITTIVTAKFGVEALKDKLTQFFKPANEPPSE